MSEVDNFNLFPVLVRQIGDFLTKSDCDEILAKLDLRELGHHLALTGDASSTFHSSVNDSLHAIDEIEKFLKIKEKLIYHTNVYARDFGTRPVMVGNSWVNIQRKGSALNYHTHPLSVVSGALYLKVDEHSSKTSFCNPNPFIDMTEVLNWTTYTFKTASITPKVGALVLFPSWLKHGSIDKNMSEERVVLSFNTVFFPHESKSNED